MRKYPKVYLVIARGKVLHTSTSDAGACAFAIGAGLKRPCILKVRGKWDDTERTASVRKAVKQAARKAVEGGAA